jgi:hypothetical protein
MGSWSHAALKEPTRPDGQLWYYLNKSRQVGPFSLDELHFLLSKEVITSTTLVWSQGNDGWQALGRIPQQPKERKPSRQGNWKIVALGIAIFAAAISVVTKMPMVIEPLDRVVLLLHASRLSSEALDQDHIPTTGILRSEATKELTTDCTNVSPINGCFVSHPVHLILPSRTSETTRPPIVVRLAIEYWRSTGPANWAAFYETQKSKPAAVKARKTRNQTRKASGDVSANAAVERKPASRADKLKSKPTASRTTNVKTASRCRASDRCR